jgi:hypothetical protein
MYVPSVGKSRISKSDGRTLKLAGNINISGRVGGYAKTFIVIIPAKTFFPQPGLGINISNMPYHKQHQGNSYLSHHIGSKHNKIRINELKKLEFYFV